MEIGRILQFKNRKQKFEIVAMSPLLLEMDNVYGAGFLRGSLANQGIDSLIRAFHYRSQGFFFSPIVKMEILVPTEQLKRTQEIIRTSLLEII